MPDIRLTAAAALAAAAAVALPAFAAPDAADASTYGQRALAQGMSGADVAQLQRLLRRTGLRLTVDGAFGPLTASALRRFEASAGLTADGRLTVAEGRALRRAALGATTEAAAPEPTTPAAPTATRRQSEAADDSPFVGGATPQDEVRDATTEVAKEGVFPIRGRHDLGQTATNRFGGGRGHEGQDLFARCGTPVVAARSGTVAMATYQGAAGNYVVLSHRNGQSTAYMHLRRPASVDEGDRVRAGQRIGEIGDTGRATGCQLHFELWTAPGWYRGGEPVDPMPVLRRWDAVA